MTGAPPPPVPNVLLVGDAAARPAGLERALARAGFHPVEEGDLPAGVAPDAILVTVADARSAALDPFFPDQKSNTADSPPRIVVTLCSDPDTRVAVLSRGADDALAAPVHLPELCARLLSRIRARAGANADPVAGTSNGTDASAASDDPLGDRLQEEFERARRYSLSFSLVLLGADELESLGRRLGPEAVERRRQEIGGALRRELRLPDYVTVYGNHEFAIVLPETDESGARRSILRIRDRLATIPYDGDPRTEQPRFSAGIVTYPHPAADRTDDLYDLVEAALMRGRAQSGERIGVAV